MIELLELKFSRRWQTNKIESDWSNSPRHSSSRQFRSPSQRMDFATLALHISASAQDIKILNTIYFPQLSLIITRIARGDTFH